MGLDEAAVQICGAPLPGEDSLPEKRGKPRAVTLWELLGMGIPQRGHVLYPVIPEQGLVMLHAMRGVGKTYAALKIACAVASGGSVFDRWKAERPRRVLYIDGEMTLCGMQERLAKMACARLAEMPGQNLPIAENFTLINPDLQSDFRMPNLAAPEGQALIEPFLAGVDLVVIDNLATLARTGKANSEDDWWPVQEWLLSLRRRGKSALLVHHEGKNGTQRGTTAKEDILDVVIRLARPSDYEPGQGARFSVSLTKSRGIAGADAESFEAAFDPCDGTWTTKTADDSLREQLSELAGSGMTMRDIAEALGVSPATVSRKCREYGLKTRGHAENRQRLPAWALFHCFTA